MLSTLNAILILICFVRFHYMSNKARLWLNHPIMKRGNNRARSQSKQNERR